MLQVKHGKIVDEQGQPVMLRGAAIGGWLNMENFINGYPGSEAGLRYQLAQTLGPAKAEFFFDRWLDYFLAEDDLAYIKSCGANVVRLALNYRHFESDLQPYHYLESGFVRLDRVVEWCGKHGLYVILDMHAAQGWQNTDWHSDNGHRLNLLWQHPHFQDRFIALWEELARRYHNNATIAGYDVLNEPVANAPFGRFLDPYTAGYPALNALYRRVVTAIRAIDPAHIIFLEGDFFANLFKGLEAPFADNLVYSSHNYSQAGFGPGPYPGQIGEAYWDKAKIRQWLTAHEGYQFAQQHAVPLWIGEFGAVYNGPAAQLDARLAAMADQLAVMNELDIHWTTWTYKDVGVMGWVMLDPASQFRQRLAPVLQNKLALATDLWMNWLPATPAKKAVGELAALFARIINAPGFEATDIQNQLNQVVLDNYAGGLLQVQFAQLLAELSENELDQLLQSFTLAQCQPNTGLVELIKRFTTTLPGPVS